MSDKIITLNELKEAVKNCRKDNKKIATTNGTFDLLHIGHIYMLESAKRLTDVLIVLLNSDSSVKKLKGEKRPVVPEKERAEILSALGCVDFVLIFNEESPIKSITELKPDMHIKGGSFVQEKINEEKAVLESWNGRHITLPIVQGYSTTKIIEKVLDNYKT